MLRVKQIKCLPGLPVRNTGGTADIIRPMCICIWDFFMLFIIIFISFKGEPI